MDVFEKPPRVISIRRGGSFVVKKGNLGPVQLEPRQGSPQIWLIASFFLHTFLKGSQASPFGDPWSIAFLLAFLAIAKKV